MGIWNSHTSVGNILGSVVASAVLEYGWGWSFVLPGVLIMVVGVVVLAFLVVSPKDLGFEPAASEIEMSENGEGNPSVGFAEGGQGEETTLLASEAPNLDSEAAIGFLEAWRLPGVAPYAFCLFFSKLVAYTFLYWLPFYIRHTAVAGKHLSHKMRGSFQQYLMWGEYLMESQQATFLIRWELVQLLPFSSYFYRFRHLFSTGSTEASPTHPTLS